MQSRDFCYWLQGFFELSGGEATISAEQAAMIRRHLDMVFHHELTPDALARKPDAPQPAPPPAPVKSPRPLPEPAQPPMPVERPQPPMC